MKTKFRVLIIVLLAITLLLAACGPAPTVAPSPAPTLAPSPTARPTLPPGDATITFENDECTYDGPQPIPAKLYFLVNWVVKDINHSKYGLYVFRLDEGKTKEDLMASSNDAQPPSWAPIVGGWDSSPNTSMQVPINAEKGPLYFTCWSSSPDIMFQIIGPVEVAGTNP